MSKPNVDLGYPTEARGRIPSFSSIEEEAEWWDTHDSAEYDEEFVPAERVRTSDREGLITLQLGPGDLKELDRRADQMGIKPPTLVRMWVEDRLKKETS